MSYDIWLSIDTGGSEMIEVASVGNCTCNVSPMWTLALGHPIRELEGKLAADCIPALTAAVTHMADPVNTEAYEALNPPNGWGDHAGATRYLKILRDLCIRHPKCTIEMSY